MSHILYTTEGISLPINVLPLTNVVVSVVETTSVLGTYHDKEATVLTNPVHRRALSATCAPLGRGHLSFEGRCSGKPRSFDLANLSKIVKARWLPFGQHGNSRHLSSGRSVALSRGPKGIRKNRNQTLRKTLLSQAVTSACFHIELDTSHGLAGDPEQLLGFLVGKRLRLQKPNWAFAFAVVVGSGASAFA